jgi:hypothetical protein
MGAEMNEREALKLALEALDCIYSPLHVREITKVGNAMKAIKEALAQPEQEPDDLTIAYMTGFHDGKNTPQRKPEQEPVAWMDEYGDVLSANVVDGNGLRNIPLYTTSPQRTWIGLTDAEIADIANLCRWSNTYHADFARAIEAKLREKNGG